MGINFHGMKFFNFFYPTMVPFAISPFLMFIEIISFIVRLASLSLRLFANIVAGHILIETVSAFFYHISITVNSSINIEYMLGSITLLCMVFVLIIFESLIAFLQAYIFAVLLTIYMNDIFAMHS
jgi:ATP synthase subunit 6